MTTLNNNRAWHKFIAIVFIGLICIPGLVMLMTPTQTISLHEKRHLSAFPSLQFDRQGIQDYAKQFEKFFNDQFGFREQFIFTAGYLKRKLFRKSNSSKVILGVDGWSFMEIRGSLKDRVGLYPTSDETLESWARAHKLKQDWLESLGINYLLVIAPNKSTVYPEKLPLRIRSHIGTTRLEQFLSFRERAAYTENILNLANRFNQLKSEQQIYLKTDTHWNDFGAYSAYQEITHWLDQQFGEFKPLSMDEFNISNKAKYGDIAIAGMMTNQPEEIRQIYSPANPCFTGEHHRAHSFSETLAYKERPKKLPVIARCEKQSRTAIVVHDSFGESLKKYLDQHFKKVIYMRSYDPYKMKTFLLAEKPDVYIDIRAERNFFYLLAEDENMKKELENKDSG